MFDIHTLMLLKFVTCKAIIHFVVTFTLTHKFHALVPVFISGCKYLCIPTYPKCTSEKKVGGGGVWNGRGQKRSWS